LVLKINGNTINFTKDYTLLQICDSIGVRVPRFCYNDQMHIAGNCRMCLVEIKGGPKPLVSCTSRGIPNMEIYTESPLVKKAREGVLEFLLSNHPLDCPICDQGGECDLQDQSEKFGGDSSRNFFFYKRPVQDKDMGLFIKTIMVRCIHCTRCIRFLKDKALTNDLGTVGRGEKTEISFYFNKFLDKSLLCGNIVDICPVGALTNKNYSFKGRPWEIDEIKYSGISDTLGLNVKLAIKRGTNKIIRITPNFSNETNTKIISDFSRYCIDGISLDRIELFNFKTTKKKKNFLNFKLSSIFQFKNLSSKFFLNNLSKINFIFFIGPYTSLKDLLLLFFHYNEKGATLWYNASFLKSGFLSIYPFNYTSKIISDRFVNSKNSSLTFLLGKKKNLKDLCNRHFTVGNDFLSEFPSLSSKLLFGASAHIVSRDSFFLGLLPYKKKNIFYLFKKGLSISSLLDILEGRSKLCKNISKNLNIFIFFSVLIKKRFDGDFLQSFSNTISFIKNSNGILSSISTETSSLDLLQPKKIILNHLNPSKIKNGLFYSMHNSNRLSTEIKKISFSFSNFMLKTILFSLGELSEKITSLSFKTPLFLWVYLSTFSTKNLKLRKTKFYTNILGKLSLPKIFFLEESYDFLTTLGTYKKNFWSPLVNDSLQLNLNTILNSHENLNFNVNSLILMSKENFAQSNLVSFPIYLGQSYVYLTEIKTLSKENLFHEDSFLKKSPQLLKLITFFRTSHNNFKN
jgi:hypothetical protein